MQYALQHTQIQQEGQTQSQTLWRIMSTILVKQGAHDEQKSIDKSAQCTHANIASLNKFQSDIPGDQFL